MNGTSVSNRTRLLPISISQRSFGNFPESLGKWKTPKENEAERSAICGGTVAP